MKWKTFKKIEILDREGRGDDVLEIPNGFLLKQNLVGKKTNNFYCFLFVAHFKEHIIDCYGGALKQLSIGFASRVGKTLLIYYAGKNDDANKFFDNVCQDKEFKEAMADAASTIVVDYDGNTKPFYMKVIGILSSLDPVALDQTCLDLIYNSDDRGIIGNWQKRVWVN